MGSTQTDSDDVISRLTKDLLPLFKTNSKRTSIEEIVLSDSNEYDEVHASPKTVGCISDSDSNFALNSSDDIQKDEIISNEKDSEGASNDNSPTRADAISDEDSSSDSQFDCEDGNESDVIDIFDDEGDIFKKLKGESMICTRCYPSTIFRKKSLFIIHRMRHFSADHFMCPICRKGFVKLVYCINHELRVHSEETQLKNECFGSAINLIRGSGKQNTCSADTENRDNKPEKDVIYSDYAVASTSLYPYHGPPVDNLADTYKIQCKYGRGKSSVINNISKKSVRNWRTQEAGEREIEARNLVEAPQPTLENRNSSSTANSSSKSEDHNCDSSFGKKSKSKANKKKKYRKKTAKSKQPGLKAYCCVKCNFTTSVESEFKTHCQTDHSDFTVEQLLDFFILPNVQSEPPRSSVRRKKANTKPPPSKRIRYDISEESADISPVDASSFPPSPPESPIVATDYSTKEGFCSSLGLIKTPPS